VSPTIIRPSLVTVLFTAILGSLPVTALGDSAASFLPIYEHGRGRFEGDLTIGGEDADDDSFFLLPTAIRPDSQGNIFVLDSKHLDIRKFGPDGEHIVTFSRSGEGPGELGTVFQMTIDAQDRVIVWDLMYRRFTVFDNDGNYAKTVAFGPIIDQLEATAAGHVFATVQDTDFGTLPAKTLTKILRFSPDLEHWTVVDSVQVVDSARIPRDGGGLLSVNLAYYEDLLWSTGPDGGLVTGFSGEYRLRLLSPQLELLRVIEREAERFPVTKEDRERYYAGFARHSDETFMKVLRKEVSLPKQKPYFDGIWVDHEGYVLVELPDVVEKATRYDIFTPQGEFLCQAELPWLGHATIRHGFIYRTAREGEDIVVRRYRLVAD
jgi:hypothetical protein